MVAECCSPRWAPTASASSARPEHGNSGAMRIAGRLPSRHWNRRDFWCEPHARCIGTSLPPHPGAAQRVTESSCLRIFPSTRPRVNTRTHWPAQMESPCGPDSLRWLNTAKGGCICSSGRVGTSIRRESPCRLSILWRGMMRGTFMSAAPFQTANLLITVG